MQPLNLKIDGMSCAHCVRAVQQAIERLDGVQVERVEIGDARVTYDPRRTTPDRILAAVADEGYVPHVANG